jgi:hypothetical protein
LRQSEHNDEIKLRNLREGLKKECKKSKCDCSDELEATLNALAEAQHAICLKLNGDNTLKLARERVTKLRLHSKHMEHIDDYEATSVPGNSLELLSILIPVKDRNYYNRDNYINISVEELERYAAMRFIIRKSVPADKFQLAAGAVTRYAKEGIGSLDCALTWAYLSTIAADEIETVDDWRSAANNKSEQYVEHRRNYHKNAAARKRHERQLQKEQQL